MLSPLSFQFTGLEMTLDIATLCWVLRARIKLHRVAEIFAVVFDIFHSSSNDYSTQNSPKQDAKNWIQRKESWM